MKIKEIMHKGVEWVTPDTPVLVLAKKMHDEDIGAIPISEKGQMIGMVTDRDLALRALADGKDTDRLTAREVMTRGAVCCR